MSPQATLPQTVLGHHLRIAAHARVRINQIRSQPLELVDLAGRQVLMPQFYDDVWGEPMTWYLLGGSFAWLMIGNAMMFKMSNFKF